ncbi:NAD-glutamate dehydrogenase [Magnetospira sp. QH-2]|uniref:NAD-glutamate dehydrogenase n=1 Tax=Magnetospira sp. (strain QH-2) TaxID=1288970 RepID=UPI0003E81551|nr:NAD-glutamate dehydrogenase [Magnetospira sp. QH-2]CCQ72092.1 NAD-glutamate dehydrogenase [Magnetospira sp. QH-2]
MVLNPVKQKADLIEKAVTEANERLDSPLAENAATFMRQFYRRVMPEDMIGDPVDRLFGGALSLWLFGTKRQKGGHKVRVYNPSLEEHGWRAEQTVVEVVISDRPFLIDSISAALSKKGLAIHRLVHPLITLSRDDDGAVQAIMDGKSDDEDLNRESYIQVLVTKQSSGERLKEIQQSLDSVLRDVDAAVTDWRSMVDRMDAVLAELDEPPANLDAEVVSETRDFLNWLHHGNYTFLGYRFCSFVGAMGEQKIEVDGDSALGLLGKKEVLVFKQLVDGRPLPGEVRAFVHKPDIMMVTKANLRSTVHRDTHMDTICIKKYDAEGRVAGQHVFVGLFTASAYNRTPTDIPMIAKKVNRILDAAGLPRSSHDAKVMLNVLETFPRDELFQIGEQDLLEIAQGIMHLQQQPRVALFVRRDDFERFMSCLVYIPRDRYTTNLRKRIQKILESAFNAETSAYYIQVSDGALARLHIIMRTEPGIDLDYNVAEIEAEIIETARTWTDRLEQALVEARGEEIGLTLFQRYGEAFPSGYTDRFNVDAAVADVELVDSVLAAKTMDMNLYRPLGMSPDRVRLKIYHPNSAVPLSDVLPMLEHMGFKVMDEVPYEVRPGVIRGKGSDFVMIHDFGLQTRDGGNIDLGVVRENFEEAFQRVWAGDAESDGFNALILSAGLAWREVAMLRGLCKYLRQAAIPFSQAYMEQTLGRNAHLARQIVQLFLARFDPARAKMRDKTVGALHNDLMVSLEEVASADEDRILKRFINVVESTLRTNYFQTDGEGNPQPYISFKLDSQNVEELPLPRPWREIFVYSPRVEAVHLRGGPVARGGLRWSDRQEDFRTEILGLVKAQQVKNAVIVPVGSKGGFVVKRPPTEGGRQAFIEEGIACYKSFIAAMLEITDNLDGDSVVPPTDVVRHDGDDSYLVVAADKGTATFSDIANGVAIDHGFWLGDAFASGGSNGYDHKAMGITAKGGWESVKRHFREMGVDTQSQEFTVAGVGDMGGDVFGNGMLLSPHIKLVAAFNHLHIFIDPDPDAAKTFKERTRLFNDIKGWDAYDQKLLSKGGAIFQRSSKKLKLTPEIKKVLGISKDTVTPTELIRAILTAEIDLLWFGGIGTYIKSTTETHADAGDRANDAVRIDAPELRCKVIGEGANLGVTQRARIQFALRGGRLNTDSIDNSAGVDCSDHEVNIKILLDKVVSDGDMTPKQRTALLEKMTDEVGELVLRDNYLQSQALTIVASQGTDILDQQVRLMRMLERTGRLDRAVEFLPDDETLSEREAAGQGLTRPEISILMPYAKIWLFDQVMESDLPDDPALAEDLIRYFPTALRKKYRKVINEHRLRREIVATYVANAMINRVGGYFVTQIAEKTGLHAAEVARAYLITRDVFNLREVWAQIEALDNKVRAEVQTRMLLEVNRLVDRGTMWFLRQMKLPLDIGANVARFAPGVATLTDQLDQVLATRAAEDLAARKQGYLEAGLDEDLALRMAGLMVMVSGCDIVRLASDHDLSVEAVAKHYFAVGGRFKLGFMRAAAEELKSENHWQKLAVAALIEDLYGHQMALTSKVLSCPKRVDSEPDEAIANWVELHSDMVGRTEQMLSEMWAGDKPDFSMLAVSSRQLRALAEDSPEGSAC